MENLPTDWNQIANEVGVATYCIGRRRPVKFLKCKCMKLTEFAVFFKQTSKGNFINFTHFFNLSRT